MSHLFEKINNGGVYVICEMSANHGGKLENALKIVHKAKEIAFCSGEGMWFCRDYGLL